MEKKKMKYVMSLVSDFRDSAAAAVRVHLQLIDKLANDMAVIIEKPASDRTMEDQVLLKYYTNNLQDLVQESISAITKYSAGTDKYILALESFLESIEKE
nr:MAG TPA: hypothetical protein [Caudoviricetes sp.]